MLTIKYTCDDCGLKDREVIVPEREHGQNIVDYVQDFIGQCVKEDHSRVSPNCLATKITQLKIPIDPKTIIGQKPQ